MSVPSIVGISGSPKRTSRTTAVVRAVLEAIEASARSNSRLIELVDAAPVLFRALTRDSLNAEQQASSIIRTVEAADVLVVGTPVYRASYSGALKHLFDLVHHEALAGKLVVLVATAGSPVHGLVNEHQLRPLFGFFNALTVPTTIFATEADFVGVQIVNPKIDARIARAAREVVELLASRNQPGVAAPAAQRSTVVTSSNSL
jgi:FMN reductase